MKTSPIKKQQKVAIFDIDGTIFRSSLLIEIVEVLIELDHFPAAVRKQYEKEKVRWMDRKGDYEAYIMAVVRVFLKNMKGLPEKAFVEAAHIVVDRYRDRVYLYARELIAELKKKDYYLLAISNSPKGILDIFCDVLGFDKVYGRYYEVGEDKKYTGKIIDEHMIASKANLLKRAVKNNDLTLKGSVGVGDTESDISFLRLVEHPICFNPNANLFKHAKRRHWKVVVERKDVIYKL
jgi:HAD superfamily hydrolase (TIGR01490 family)